jgi:PAS domain S-box-containing protein
MPASFTGTDYESQSAIVGNPYRFIPVEIRSSGYAEADLVGQSLDILAPTQEQDIPEADASLMSSERIFSELDPLAGWEGELWSQRHSGEVFPIWLRVNGVRDQRSILEGYVAVISDVTHRKKAEAELRRMATRDTLTGLPNRGLFISLLEDAVDHVTDSVFDGADAEVGDEMSSGCGLLFIDLDGFKAVNDTFGHEAGDEVLKSVARRLKSTVRASDRVARLAGDEFVILLSDARHLKDSRSPDGLLRAADAAMYRAKKTGKNKWCAYRDVAAV